MSRVILLFLTTIMYSLFSCQRAEYGKSVIEQADDFANFRQYSRSLDTLLSLDTSRLDYQERLEYYNLVVSNHLHLGSRLNYDSLINPMISQLSQRDTTNRIRFYSLMAVGRALCDNYVGSNNLIDSILEQQTGGDLNIGLIRLKASNLKDSGGVDLVDLLVAQYEEDRPDIALAICSSMLNHFVGLGDEVKSDNYATTLISCLEKGADWQYMWRARDYSLDAYCRMLQERGDYRRAYELKAQLYNIKKNRSSSREFTLAKARLKLHRGELDSARYFAEIVAEDGNIYLSLMANELLEEISLQQNDYRSAIRNSENKSDRLYEGTFEINNDVEIADYRQIILERENELLEFQKRTSNLIIVIIVIIVLVLVMGLYLLIRRRENLQRRQLLKVQANQLEQENRLLKQSQEITLLSQKEAILRESLFRKIGLFKKIPSLSKGEHRSKAKRILLSQDDWYELITSVNELYPNFVDNLRADHPKLSDDDISFCCFLKINVNLQDLSDIYCVSKSAITKRKYRVKVDKMGIDNSELSLDNYLKKR